MRLDNYLKMSRLIKKRTLAKELCKHGSITVNGLKAKAGKEVKEGDKIKISMWNRTVKVAIREIPCGNVSKSDAQDLYYLLEEQNTSREIEW